MVAMVYILENFYLKIFKILFSYKELHMSTLKHLTSKILRFISMKFKVDATYIAKGGFWLLGGSVAASLLSLAVSIVAAKYIPKDVFGIYKYILSMAGVAGALSLSGINTIVTRSVSQGFEGVFLQSLKTQFKWSFLQFLFIFSLAGYYFINENVVYAISFCIASICVPLSTIANTYSAFLSGKKDFKTSSLYSFLSTCVYAFTFIVVATFIPNTLTIITTYLVVTTSANIYFCFRTIRTYKPNTTTQGGDSSYAIKLSATNSFGIIAANIDSIIVYHLLGPVSLAIYNFAIIIPDKIRSLFGFIHTIALPKLSAHSESKKYVILYYTLIIGIFSLALIGTYVLLAPYIFGLLFPNYLDSISFSQLYSISLIALPAAFIMTVLSAYKMEKQLYFLNIFIPILKILLLAVFIFMWGILGAIVARVITVGIHLAISALCIRTSSATS